MNSNAIQAVPQKPRRPERMTTRWIVALLVAALLWGQAGGLAAAEDTITAVELSSIPSNTVYVNEDSIALTLWATVSGSTTKKDVTSVATWTSSNSAVSVSGGVVTASSSAKNVVITGKYSGYTATVTINSVYRYSSIELRKQGESAALADKLDIRQGESLSLNAIGKETNGGGETDVTDEAAWSTSNSSVATVEDGVVTLLASGEATITVSYLGRTDSVKLTVSSPYSSLKFDQSGPIEMYVGDDDYTGLTVTATLKAGGTETVTDKVTWSSSNTGVVTVDEDGAVTPVGVGTAEIKATYLGVTGTITFVVRTPYEALRITPEKTLKISLQGGPKEISAYVLNNLETKTDVTTAVTWTSSNLVTATVDIAGGKAYVTPKSAGTTTITASYKGLTKTLNVTVYPTITELTIDEETIDTYADESGTLPSVGGKTLADETIDISDAVTWTSSNDSVVEIEDGKWKALKTGTATLTATLTNGGGDVLSGSFEVVVNEKVHLLIPSTESMSMIIGTEVAYPEVTVVYENGNEETITDKVKWTSSSVNLLVKETTWKGLAAAKATLTGTYLNATVKMTVTVEEEFVSFTIDPTSIELTLKKTKNIKVTGKTKSGKKVSIASRIEWASSDETVATVDGARVKAIAEGSGKITGSIQGKTLTIPFKVTAKLTKITASNGPLTLKPGTTGSVKLTALYENGKTVDVTSLATWTATSTKVATVNASGVVTGVAKGSTTVKAKYDGKTVTIRVKVEKP
ncbi:MULTISPECIES: Ig-like domain-containing protein [Cohnella]|uniref:Ig-like domain-containing protein n=1 Tax=Cohnella TaxID=329857 RepID=UPI001594C132|nr:MULTISPECIES: Ig-like domain-containing protein [Cohnella]MBN2980293.1 Ig-like domain-containing protein [Cohnella algarum]